MSDAAVGTPNRQVVEDEVRLSVPADARYLAVMRLTTAAVASRLDFSIDDIEDVKLAVHEAGTLLLEAARPGDEIDLRLSTAENLLWASVEAPGRWIGERQGLSWEVLAALATDLEVAVGTTTTISFAFVPTSLTP
jgi:serine/threonine-protein kinase RsbW